MTQVEASVRDHGGQFITERTDVILTLVGELRRLRALVGNKIPS